MRTLLAILALLTAIPHARADGFTPAQRQEVIGILRDALRTDPTILRDALASLQADEERQRDQATANLLATLAPKLIDPADPVEGNPAGDVTMIEFYDTRCPYCRAMLPTIAALLRADPGIRFVMKDMPILGPASQLESRALLAAQKQNGYARLQQPVMLATVPATRDSLRLQADRQGLDGARLLADMEDPAIKARLQSNIALARQIGIDGTPAFIVGTHLISGAVELKDLQQAIENARATRN